MSRYKKWIMMLLCCAVLLTGCDGSAETPISTEHDPDQIEDQDQALVLEGQPALTSEMGPEPNGLDMTELDNELAL